MSGLMQFFRGQNKTLRLFSRQNKALRTALVVMAFLSGAAFGQSEAGQLSGRVTDPNGAVIPGANVQAKLLDTGLERTATANGEGFYTIKSLPPGIYEVTVTGQGFAAKTQKVRVFVGSIIKLNVELSVTPVTVDETIEGGGGVTVNTQTAQFSDPVSNRQINELPTITRDTFSLVTLSGNVTPASLTAQGIANSSATTSPNQDFAINGQNPTTNNVHLDGGENIVNYYSTLGQRIPLAGGQEMNVITTGFRPEYGRLLGGLVDFTTRQGSNDWNGQVYYFYRGDFGASNSFDSNARGIPLGHLVGNQPGFAVGGPIFRDKFFFFGSAEGIIQRSRINRVSLVPTPALIAASAPATQAYFAAFPLATPINGRILTVADTQALLGAPAFPGAFGALPAGLPAFGEVFYNVNNDFGAGAPQDTGFAVGRLDYVLSDRNLIYGRYAYVARNLYSGAFAASPYAGYDTGIGEINHNANVNWMHSLSSAWTMNLKGQYERINPRLNIGFATPGPRLALTGYSDANIGGVNTAFPGNLPFNPALNSLLTGALNLSQGVLDFFGNWNNHQMRFGGAYYYWQDNRNAGSFQNGLYTLQAGAPEALNNLVLGTATNFTTAINPFGATTGDPLALPVSAPNFNRSLSSYDFSLYFSDIWRATPRLSVLMGIRYDYFDRPRSRNGQVFTNYFLGPGSSVFDQVANGQLSAPGAFQPFGSPSNSEFYQRDWNNFAPRIGVAWDLTGNGKTSLRAGYGITYERMFYAVSPFFQTSSSFAMPSLSAGTGTIGPTPLSTSNFGPLGGAAGVVGMPPQLVRGIQTTIRTPYVNFFNVSIEREIAPGTVAAAQYAGATGFNLFTLYNVNRPGSGGAYLGTADPTLRLNPTLGAIYFLTTDGKSKYNAFIAEVVNSTWRSIGLQFTARYRYSKTLDNVSSLFGNNIGTFGGSTTPNLLSPFDPQNDYGPADFDVRNRFIGSFNWEVPFEWFRYGSSGWTKQLVAGWELTGIFNFQTGFPYTVFNCTAALTAETPCPRAGLAPGVSLSDIAGRNSSATPSATIPNYFSYLSGTNFVTVPGATFPPFPANTPGRNAFRGPNFWNFDFGLYKRFAITEEMSVQLRGEFYNIFNHSNLFVLNSVDIGANPVVPAQKNGARFMQFGAKFIF